MVVFRNTLRLYSSRAPCAQVRNNTTSANSLTVGTSKLQRGRLALELRLSVAVTRLVIAARFLDAAAQLLRQQLQASRRLVEQYAKGAVGFLPDPIAHGSKAKCMSIPRVHSYIIFL